MTFPLLVLEGEPRAIGEAYGEQAAELIRGNLANYAEKFAYAGLDAERSRTMGDEYAETTRRLTPRIAATLDGVAAGADVPAGDIYAMNARTELMAAGNDRTCECTAIAVQPEYTSNGHQLLAQNWDWHPDQQPYTLILATRDERGHEILTLAEAGMLAKAGLNSAGVGVVMNKLQTDRDGGTGGVPYHVLPRYVLDQPGGLTHSLTVTRLPRRASINLLVGAAEGTAVDLELAPGIVGLDQPRDGMLAHANHFVTGVDVYDQVLHLGGSSMFRDDRIRQLLGAAAQKRTVDLGDLERAFCDHLGYPVAICRHLDTSVPDRQDWSLTVSSVLMDLDAGHLRYSEGPPCEVGWTRLDLHKLFDSSGHAQAPDTHPVFA